MRRTPKKLSQATIEGHGIGKGMIFVERYGDTMYRVETIGFRYHEDCPPMFGVKPIRQTPEWKATLALRKAIERTFARGTPERGARNDGGSGQAFPGGEKVMEWSDGRHDSLASFPWITVYAGGLVRAVKPNYDDSPSVAWLLDAKLADGVIAAAQVSPKPVKLPEFAVTKKEVKEMEHEHVRKEFSAESGNPMPASHQYLVRKDTPKNRSTHSERGTNREQKS